MKSFIANVLNSRPRDSFDSDSLMEYEVEWNDGSIEWVCEKELKEEK